MKLLLTSAGLQTQEIANALASLVGKPLSTVNVAIINEASAIEPGDKRWFFDEMDRLRSYVGGEIDIINLLALDSETVEQRLAFADVIYVVGGVTDYLMNVFERTGFNKLLKNKLLENKVYVGASAGSMVVGQRINTDKYKEIYRKGDPEFGVTEYMALVDFAIFPHLNSPIFTRNRPEIITTATQGMSCPVYAIEDTQAVIVNDNAVRFVGGNPLTIN